MDGVWLEHLLDDTSASVTYQHGVAELRELMATDPTVTAAVLIRPVGVAEIERTARDLSRGSGDRMHDSRVRQRPRRLLFLGAVALVVFFKATRVYR